VCRADYHLHMLIVMKSGSLNLLEPSDTVQACTGIALPLPLPLTDRLNNTGLTVQTVVA